MGKSTSTTNGLERIATLFEGAQAKGHPAFLPYYPIGYPDYETSLAIIEAMAEEGVDGFEIGIPFSDPLADGPTIQTATQHALENGITTRKCLNAVKELRSRGVHQPMLLMGYLNPFLAYGIEVFVRDAREAGADGLIIPDLPPEEAGAMLETCRQAGMGLILFLAPTSDEQRIKLVAERASGFIYIVSLTGITGARDHLPPELSSFLNQVRKYTDQPLVVGFGISKPEHVRTLQNTADGFIVGSALVQAGSQSIDKVQELTRSLSQAIDT